ncbi:hypothetical protein BS78_02G081900 [Paspalum vaginatum]|nr:hypothetical protein BS78_02G081900 [Paspalum vaginatum]
MGVRKMDLTGNICLWRLSQVFPHFDVLLRLHKLRWPLLIRHDLAAYQKCYGRTVAKTVDPHVNGCYFMNITRSPYGYTISFCNQD